MDKFTPKERSLIMSKIRSQDTQFELVFLKKLRQVTRKKFEINVTDIKGKPDIVFRNYKLCIFLDSNFWHGWQYPRWKHILKTNYWINKIENNRKRDRKVTAYLRKKGWTVFRLWEHDLKRNPDKQMQRIIKFLS